MKASKSKIQLTALVLSFVFTNTVLAAESITTESNDNATANTISNTTSPVAQKADSKAASAVAKADTAVSTQQASQPQAISDDQSYRKQMDERRQQAQEAQLESYKRFLERRKQYSAINNNVPADVQKRRDEFIKQMEERQALNIKKMEERRALNISKSGESKDDSGIANTNNNTAPPVAQKADSKSASTVAKADTAVSAQQASQPQAISDDQSYRMQMDERRQLAQEAQQESYNRFLERRKQYSSYNDSAINNNIPADVQKRRDEFIKQMEERRALNIKRMEEHRKAATERREAMQLEMHKTDSTPELEKKA